MDRNNLTIDVNINPNDQPSSTATPIQEKPNIANKTANLKTIAAVGLIANAGRQVFMSTLGQVGTITGNQQLQRNINKITTLGGITAAFAVNPIVGTLTLTTTAITDSIQTAIKIRDENNSAEYYRRVSGTRTNKGRIK